MVESQRNWALAKPNEVLALGPQTFLFMTTLVRDCFQPKIVRNKTCTKGGKKKQELVKPISAMSQEQDLNQIF